jgi:hypothetical protein
MRTSFEKRLRDRRPCVWMCKRTAVMPLQFETATVVQITTLSG